MNSNHSIRKFYLDDLIPKGACTVQFFTDSGKERYTPKRILKSGPCTIVFWSDGTKTMVRCASDEEDNDYAAFTAALAIKLFGSNSALKRMIKNKTSVQKPKKVKAACSETCPIDFDAIEQNLASVKTAKTPEEAGANLKHALTSARETADELRQIISDKDGLFGMMGLNDAD